MLICSEVLCCTFPLLGKGCVLQPFDSATGLLPDPASFTSLHLSCSGIRICAPDTDFHQKTLTLREQPQVVTLGVGC